MFDLNKVYKIDCMEALPHIPAKSIDMILCDLPYGILECEWDKPLDLTALFEQYNRIIKDNAAIVLTATCKFAIDLINANRKYFRYDLIWEKTLAVGFANSRRMPLRSHELILVFYKKLPTYNPQGLVKLDKEINRKDTFTEKDYTYRASSLSKEHTRTLTNYPRSVLRFPNGNHNSLHPTQKPLEMFKYLVLTYTNEGNTILDNCMGSGTTAVACIETKRNFIGFENNDKYYKAACDRIEKAKQCWQMAEK